MNDIYADPHHLPLLFWAAVLVLLLLAAYAFHQRQSSWAIPCLAVLGTTFTWYLGDVLYTGVGPISTLFSARIIDRALAQVILFSVAYGLIVREVTRWFVRTEETPLPFSDHATIFADDDAQAQIVTSLWFVIVGWTLLFLLAQVMHGFPLLASLFPPLAGYSINLWSRQRLGGSTDFLLSTGYYMHIFFCAMFGAFFILARRQHARIMAGFMMALTWPYWLFARGRNVVLVIGIPLTAGFLIFSRKRPAIKLAAIVLLFMAVSFWFKIVVATRSHGVAEAVIEMVKGGESRDFLKTQKHLGLDMFKELCYVNTFIDKGTHEINWGMGYIAEAVNFVPRGLWANKPKLGVEYSIARGMETRGMGNELVSSLITTGMIGQGVVNFGFILGPITAAFLMALWTGVLARFWMQRHSVMRTSLFLMGLGLTFNTGRNITLQVFFPFVFGYLLIRLYELKAQRAGGAA